MQIKASIYIYIGSRVQTPYVPTTCREILSTTPPIKPVRKRRERIMYLSHHPEETGKRASMEGDCKNRQGRLDLFSFFMFEASGDSEGDFPDDPNVGCSRHRRHYGGFCKSITGEAATHDDDDDAESCVLGSSRSLLSDYGSDDPHEKITAAKEADHERRLVRDLQATTSPLDRHRDDSREMSCISEDSIGKDHPHHHRHDRRNSSRLSDDSRSTSKNQLHHHHRYHKFLSEKEKDKLFWEACLAS